MGGRVKLICKIDGKYLREKNMGYWVVLFEKKVNGNNRYYGEAKNITNNIAEYNALILALEKAPKNCSLSVETDSALVVGQVQEGWNINEPHLYELVERIKDLCRRKNIDLELIWIPREKNTADLVLNRHLQKIGVLEKKCPYCKRPLP